jgi:murein DD-endopeptidase MepM/ murein hydrolase activator NlpD
MQLATPFARTNLDSDSCSRVCPTNRWGVRKRDTSRLLPWLITLCLLFGLRILGEDPAGKSSCTRETLIRISSERDGAVTRLMVENLQAAEVTVTFEMDLTNLAADVALPYTATIAGKKRVKLFDLKPLDPARGWSWTYTYYSTFGSTTAEHDNSCIYVLPYGPGKAYRVSQGYNGEYSHFGADQFAIDWRMPVGSPVHAARGGLVVGVKNDSSIGGDDSKYDWDANYILIQHPDGTLGQYVHLMKGGAKVKLGQRVEPGDLIGLSGNTGHSTGPHLHFSVFKARDGKHRETIPIRYRSADALAVNLEEGRSYRAGGVPGSGSLLAGTGSKTLGSAVVAAGSSAAVDAGAQSGNAVGH